jgi:hypothetical protein
MEDNVTATIKERAKQLELTLTDVYQLAGMGRATFYRRMAAGEFTQLELNALAHVLGYRTTAELLGTGRAA